MRHRITVRQRLFSHINGVMTMDVPLKEYFDVVMDERQRAVQLAVVNLEQRFRDLRDNVVIAKGDMDKRLDLLNELRTGVLPRDAFDAYVKASEDRYRTAMTSISQRIDDVRNRVTELNTQVAKGPPELPELRTQVSQDVGERITRNEYEQKHEALINELAKVRADIAQINTQIAKGPPELPELSGALKYGQGQQVGSARTLATTISIIVLFVMMLGVIVALVIGLTSGSHVAAIALAGLL